MSSARSLPAALAVLVTLSAACHAPAPQARGASASPKPEEAPPEQAVNEHRADAVTDVVPPPAQKREVEANAAPLPEVAATADAPEPLLGPPKNFAPPFPASAAPGDGEWQPWPSEAQGLYRATVHPGRFSGFKELSLVAIDLRRLRLGWQVGRGEEGSERFATTQGLIPEARRAATVAAFNGGFLARHGRWGIASAGVEIQPQKDNGCTIVIDDAGGLTIGTWARLKTEVDATHVDTLRQTPPCLVEGGEVNAKLLQGGSRPWAGSNPDRKTRRRSALGLTADRHTAIYAVGVETEALDLARGMLAAGAVAAAQLDINWSWTRFVALPSGSAPGASWVPLREEMVFRPQEFANKTSSRDFFYVYVATEDR